MTRTKKTGTLLVTCTLALLLCGCGNDEDRQQAPSPEQSAARSAQPPVSTPAADEGATTPPAPEDRTTVEQADAVAAETLKDMLPASLAGMERTDASAERNPSMGVEMTTSHARYEAADGGSIRITITDAGNMPRPMRAGLAAWAVVEYSRQTDAGHEKSGTYSGFKGMEEYDTKNRRGAIRVFVADRFVVAVEGDGVAMDSVQEALGKIDLKKLAGLTSGS